MPGFRLRRFVKSGRGNKPLDFPSTAAPYPNSNSSDVRTLAARHHPRASHPPRSSVPPGSLGMLISHPVSAPP